MIDTLNVVADTLSSVAPVVIDTTFVVPDTVQASESSGWFTLGNLTEIILALMALAKIVINITPTEKDNKVFGLLDSVLNTLVPSRTKKNGGGTEV